MEKLQAFSRFHSEVTEMTGLSFNICSRCKRKYAGSSATSRVDGSAICPMCGHVEALQASVDAGILNEKVANDVLKHLKKYNIEKRRQPFYKKGDFVIFDFSNGAETTRLAGTIKIVDAEGTFDQDEEPSYDISCNGVLYKHVRESSIVE